MESAVVHDSVTDDYRDAAGPLSIGAGGLPDPSGEPDGQWLRTASGAAVWVAATASDIPFVPAGTISATDVQAAIEEVAAEAGGGVPTSRTLTAGAALTGGGTLAADRTFDVAVDGSTIEVASDALRVKADGITANEIAAGAVGASELASTAVTPATYGDATHVAQVTVDADGRITGASDVAISGGGGISAVPSARATRTAGDLTLNSNAAWAELAAATGGPGTGGFDLTLAAATGDVLLVGISMELNNANATLFFDLATRVSGASVNWVGGSGGVGTNDGISGWFALASTFEGVSGAIQYVVQSGDISGGNVVLRPFYRGNAATNRTLRANSAQPFQVWALNLLH